MTPLEMTCVGFLFVYSCQLPPQPATAGATFCQTAKPIYWAAGDTRMTKEQVDSHNRVYKRLCASGGNKK